MFATFARSSFNAVALGCMLAVSTFCGLTAQGQSEPEGFITPAELRRSRAYVPAVAEMIVDHATFCPPSVPGFAWSPPPTPGQQATLLAGALAEDAGYRIGQAMRAVASGFDPSIIIGNDWTKVTNARATPYRATCHIETWWRDGSKTSGTAFFVGPQLLLTNAHNCWLEKKGGHAELINVIPARNGDSHPFGGQALLGLAVPDRWKNDEGNRDYDYAFIFAGRTLYNRVGYHYGCKTSSNAELESYNLNSNGYPDAYRRNYQMYKDFEKRDQDVFARHFLHYHDTLGGSSGSPMYVLKNGRRYVVGIHCAGSTQPKKRYNVATRVTKEVVKFVQDFNRQYP